MSENISPQQKIQNELKKLPKFKTEDEEREFWATHSMTDYFDWDNALINPGSLLEIVTHTYV